MSFFSFRKDEILRKKKLIDRLFAEGTSFFIYPFKIFWLATPTDTEFPAQMLVSVAKRNFKNAADRNRIKRQIREIYRVNKHQLYDHLDQSRHQCVLAIIYTANVHISSEELEIKIKSVLKRLIFEMDKKLNNPGPTLSIKKIPEI
jgi:ribonuclease P protein component